MAGCTKKSLKGKGSFAVYKSNNSFGKNKVRKLQSHLAKHPEDATAAAALAIHKRNVASSPRWNYKNESKLSSSDRLHDQTVSSVSSGLNQLQYLVKHTNIEPQGKGFTSDQLKARDRAHQEVTNA